MTDIETIKRLGLPIIEKEIKVEEITFDNCDHYNLQQNYKRALQLISEQHNFILYLKSTRDEKAETDKKYINEILKVRI